MDQFKVLCAVCGTKFAGPSVGPHCGVLACKMAWLNQQRDKGRRAVERKKEALEREIQSFIETLESDTLASEKVRRIVKVPFHSGRSAPSKDEEKEAFLHHLKSLLDVEDDASQSAEKRYVPLLQAEPSPALAPVLGSMCATCNGFCCTRGKGTHAFIQRQTLGRVLAENPQMDKAALLRRYEENIPLESVADSCIFHTETGCCLEPALKADICNRYYCESLHDVIEGNNRGALVDEYAVFALQDGEIKARAVVSSHPKTAPTAEA